MKSATNSRAALRADPSTTLARSLTGVGPATAAKFAELGIETPEQMLAHLPRAYRDWRVRKRSARLPKVKPSSSDAYRASRSARPLSARHGKPRRRYRHDRGEVLRRRHLFGRFAPGDGCSSVARDAGRIVAEINVTAHRELRGDEPYVGEIVRCMAHPKICRRARSAPRSRRTSTAS